MAQGRSASHHQRRIPGRAEQPRGGGTRMNASSYKVLLTNPILPSEHARLAQHAKVVLAPDKQPDTLRRLIADADALIVRRKLPDHTYDHQARLKGALRHGVGRALILTATP